MHDCMGGVDFASASHHIVMYFLRRDVFFVIIIIRKLPTSWKFIDELKSAADKLFIHLVIISLSLTKALSNIE